MTTNTTNMTYGERSGVGVGNVNFIMLKRETELFFFPLMLLQQYAPLRYGAVFKKSMRCTEPTKSETRALYVHPEIFMAKSTFWQVAHVIVVMWLCEEIHVRNSR